MWFRMWLYFVVFHDSLFDVQFMDKGVDQNPRNGYAGSHLSCQVFSWAQILHYSEENPSSYGKFPVLCSISRGKYWWGILYVLLWLERVTVRIHIFISCTSLLSKEMVQCLLVMVSPIMTKCNILLEKHQYIPLL